MTPTPSTPDSHNQPQNRQPADKPETLGHIQTDRPCASCGFNLFGQIITRDEHYNMPIARCSECGQVAALQEYPGLGAWARRWSGMIAALWLLSAVSLFGVTLAVSISPVGGFLVQQYDDIAITILEAYTTDLSASDPESDLDIRRWTSIPRTWVDSTDIGARVREHGSVLSQLDQAYPTLVVSSWLILFASALPLPVAQLGATRLRVAVYCCFTMTAGAVIVALTLKNQALSSTSAQDLALGVAWPTLIGVTYPILFTAGFAAAFTGRPLARAIIRAALPPRLRLPFAELWRADNKDMPAATGR